MEVNKKASLLLRLGLINHRLKEGIMYNNKVQISYYSGQRNACYELLGIDIKVDKNNNGYNDLITWYNHIIWHKKYIQKEGD